MKIERQPSTPDLSKTFREPRSKSAGRMLFRAPGGASPPQPPPKFFKKVIRSSTFNGSLNSKTQNSSSDLSEDENRILSELQNASSSLLPTLEKILRENKPHPAALAMHAFSKTPSAGINYWNALMQIFQKEEWVSFCSEHFSTINGYGNQLIRRITASNTPQQIEKLALLYFPHDIKREKFDDTFLRNSSFSSKLLIHLTHAYLQADLLKWCKNNPKPTPERFIKWLEYEETPNKTLFHQCVQKLRIEPLRTYLEHQEADVEYLCRIAIADIVFLRTINPIIFQSSQTEEIKRCFKELQGEANNTTLGVETCLTSYLDLLLTSGTQST